MGFAVAEDLRGLSRLSDTAARVGIAVQDTGRAMESLSQLPVVGEQIAPAAKSVTEAGASAIESAEETRASVRRTSVLLGLSIALMPTLPVALFYLPRRRAVRRERR